MGEEAAACNAGVFDDSGLARVVPTLDDRADFECALKGDVGAATAPLLDARRYFDRLALDNP